MPAIFIYAVVAFAVLIVLLVVLGMVFGGLRLKKGGAPGIDGSSGGSDSTMNL